MDVSLADIELFSQCPRKYKLNAIDGRPPAKDNIILSTFQHVISAISCSDKPFTGNINARLIHEYIEGYVARAMPSLSSDEDFIQYTEISDQLLACTLSWYEKYFLTSDHADSIKNLPLIAKFGEYKVGILIPLVNIGINNSNIELIDFTLLDLDPFYLYNSLRYHTWIYALEKEVGTIPQVRVLRPSTRATYDRLLYPHKFNDTSKRTEKYIQQICSGIKNGIDYQSRGEQCTTCVFKTKCSF